MKFSQVNYHMTLALDMAYEAYKIDEVPVGAIIVNSYGKTIAQAYNTKEKEKNACNHAEILAIAEASKNLEAWRLVDCDIYVTLEPCPMCMAALSQARIRSIFFGAYDSKGGATSLGLNLHKDNRLNHKINVYGGFQHIKCSKLISDFFKQKRGRYKT